MGQHVSALIREICIYLLARSTRIESFLWPEVLRGVSMVSTTENIISDRAASINFFHCFLSSTHSDARCMPHIGLIWVSVTQFSGSDGCSSKRTKLNSHRYYSYLLKQIHRSWHEEHHIYWNKYTEADTKSIHTGSWRGIAIPWTLFNGP